MKNRKSQIVSRKWSSGQAMIELIVALVVVLALLAGLLQLTSLTNTHTNAMVEARRLAGLRAMSDTGYLTQPDYIRDWQEGLDGTRYSADDVSTPANPADFQDDVVDGTVADPSEWNILDAIPNNPVSSLHSSQTPVTEFGLVHGEANETVDLLPAVQHLLYADDHIDIKADVWMAWTKGIY